MTDIVVVIHDLGGTGGMERQSERMVSGLLDAGLRVTVIARTCQLAPHPGLEFVRIRTPRRPFPIAEPAFMLAAALPVARRRGAIIHSTGAIVANRVDVTTVHYCHSAARTQVEGSRASHDSRLYRLNARLARWISWVSEQWCYRPGRARRLCAVSGGVAAELREHFPRAAAGVRSVPNGVDTEAFRPDAGAREVLRTRLGLPATSKVALFVGGDWERKGLLHAVGALAEAPGWQLVVAGPGDADALRARAQAAGTADRLHLLGPVREMPPVYAAADAFVFPTAYEAFPLVALEAAASGLPLLATRVNGIEDLLEDGVNGWFVERDAHTIARRLRELGEDEPRARRMAAAAREAAGRYTWDAMVGGYLEVYRELTPRPPAATRPAPAPPPAR